MRIASPAVGRWDWTTVDPCFGRCPYFTLVDVRRSGPPARVPNPYYERHEPGQVPRSSEQSAQAWSLGHGRLSCRPLPAARNQPVTGAAGTVREALGQYLAGSLRGAGPCRDRKATGSPAAALRRFARPRSTPMT